MMISTPSRPRPRLRILCSDDGSVARLKKMADSSQDAAKLLLQVRRIAIDELTHDNNNNDTRGGAHPVTPVQRPRETVSVPKDLTLSHMVSPRSSSRWKQNTETPITDFRLRAISICSQADIEEFATAAKEEGHVTPLQQPQAQEGLQQPQLMSVERGAPPDPPNPGYREESPPPGKLVAWHLPACSENDREDDDDDDKCVEEERLLLLLPNVATQDYATLYPNKFVGESLPLGVTARDVLRKKFSWKSFPELEAYLVDHRPKYLECSNALNYTKAQKHYNNQLTQGLLDLAADEGYLFEGFTFAAVRDRIRCFYKSFVQATKKKKRLKVQKRGRSVTM